MKRQNEISKGVFNYSTGQVGTSDLPAFIAEVCTRKPYQARSLGMALSRIKAPSINHVGWRSQLASAYGKLKQANKKH